MYSSYHPFSIRNEYYKPDDMSKSQIKNKNSDQQSIVINKILILKIETFSNLGFDLFIVQAHNRKTHFTNN